MINRKIDTIFDFLSTNRQYNKATQESFYESVILPRKAPADKVIALLHFVVNTQSQPKIDKLANFFQLMYQNKDDLSSFEGFVKIICQKAAFHSKTYSDVYENLQSKDGWGKKTAALFVKSLYHVHNGEYGEQLKIWNDAPIRINNEKRFFLPVDSVIEFIFSKLDLGIKNDFDGINDFVRDYYKSSEKIEIWDDLWFWGFITQKGGGKDRQMVWNENKYWALLESPKEATIIKEIELKANEFIRLLK